MAIDKVQLKQETVVGEDVVLEDIYPKSSTSSINDKSTGASLDQTIERLWNAINSKLSRIVNSVNGRTGVVVLKPEDVGLGDVDNVSFSDIKQWVINKLQEEFGNKRLKLFESLHDLDSLISLNNPVYRDTPFFSSHGYGGDKKSYIGYIYLDEETNELKFKTKSINTVGYTDNSMIYDENINDKNLTGGGLGVNIWKYEDALKLYESVSGNKEDSGLMIDKSKMVPRLIWFDGVYGDGLPDDPNSFLYYRPSTIPPNAPSVKIFINERQIIADLKIKYQSIKEGDLVICNFKDYRTRTDEGMTVPEGMLKELMFRNPSIGRVDSAPTLIDTDKEYIVKFYSIKPVLGWGLKYVTNHKTEISDDEITIQLTKGKLEDYSQSFNASGLQVFKDHNDPNPDNINEEIDLEECAQYTILPEGKVKVLDNNSIYSSGGLSITPDCSMSIIPQQMYDERHSRVSNWKVKSPIRNVKPVGCSEDISLLGINLLKSIDKSGDKMKFANLSGLRIYDPTDYVSLESTFGMKPGDYKGNIIIDDLKTSGGLSVNVGKFLEIDPGSSYQYYDDMYYDGGKVNVRLGDGLTGDGQNRIKVNIGESLTFDENKKCVDIKEGFGIVRYPMSAIDDSPFDPDNSLGPAGIFLTDVFAANSIASMKNGFLLGGGLELSKVNFGDGSSSWKLSLCLPGVGKSNSFYGFEKNKASIVLSNIPDSTAGFNVPMVNKVRTIRFIDKNNNELVNIHPLDNCITADEALTTTIKLGNGLKMTKDQNNYLLEVDINYIKEALK